jgi:tRNA nucleotidyltransferase (CCA-adding enzyme)
VGAELRLALEEFHPLATLALLDKLGVLAALHPRLGFDERLVARALTLLPPGGRRNVLMLAVALLPLIRDAEGSPEAEAAALLNRLEFSGGERDHTLATALAAVPLVDELLTRETPAELYDLVAGVPLESVALAGALGGDGNGRSGAREIAIRWLYELRHVRLEITGDDLVAAGVPQGPEIGRRLRATLAMRLNGELEAGREAELAAALALP